METKAGSSDGGRSRDSGILQTLRRPLRFPGDGDFRILSLDGGGIKGVYTAALLAALERNHLGGESVARHFDLVAGTSVGGLIALILAAGSSAQAALDLFLRHGEAIFQPTSRRLLRAGHSSEPLHAAAQELLGGRVLGDSSLRLCIPAVNAKRGEPCIFKTPHHPDFHFDADKAMVDVAMATAAAPTFFKAHQTDDYVLLDGGLIANNPVMVAAVDALTCFALERRRIRILSIGTGAVRPVIKDNQIDGGRFAWSAIHDSFIYYADRNADGQAGLLIGRDRMVRATPTGDDTDIDMTDAAAALTRLPKAGEAAALDIAEAAEPFFATHAPKPAFYHGLRASTPEWG